MLIFALSLLAVAAIATYLLFFSRSLTIGEGLYQLAMSLERKLAGLVETSVIIDGTQVSYYKSESFSAHEAQTKKPVLVLLHGFSADKTIWHRFAKLAKHDFDLIVPDLLGHGKTPYCAKQSYSTKQQTAMLLKLLKALNISKCSVAGNSMGGMIAAQLIEDATERVDKVVLLDPAGAKSEFAVAMTASGMNPFVHATLAQFYEFYKVSMSKPPLVPPCVLDYLAVTRYLERQNQLAHMFSDFFDLGDFFDKPFVNTNENNTLVIWGDQDQLLPVKEAEYWSKLTGTKPVIYEGIGHMPMVEHIQHTYKDCRQFLTI
ncbi:alpha/beta fold hydrolase [Ningiella sp. W23]|uniref:alpha/beta fold hydrolase n=1 Tax=Ningiella sp. W23 TaxID=3023715 RepID=UPI0037582C6E